MSQTSIIRGRIKRFNSDDDWVNAPVVFKLLTGGFDDFYQYPQNSHTVITDELGRFEVTLWCNTKGLINTHYQCILPSGEVVDFSVPATEDDEILEFSTLRQAADISSKTPDQYSAILTYFDGKISDSIENKASELVCNYTILEFDEYPEFTLPKEVLYPHLAKLYINGTKQIYARDYYIDGRTLIWNSPDTPIVESHHLEYYYH